MSDLWLFFLLVAGVVLLPGLDMAFVLASSLTHGRRAGLLAVAGIMFGGACHVTAGILGIAVVLQLLPAAFNAVLLAGAAYVAWIGWSLMKGGIALPEGEVAPSSSTFRRGALTNLLNPKAYLFTLAVFPQFLHREQGGIWVQGVKMGVIVMLTQGAIYGAIVMLSGVVRGWLAKSSTAQFAIARIVGGLLIGTAVFTGMEGWR